MNKQKSVTVRVTHRFSASAERVFDAWLDPVMASRFLFATATGAIVRAEIDARVGGTFTIVDRRAGEDVVHVGTYLELERPGRLVFTLKVPKYSEAEDRVSIEIRPLDHGCELTLCHEMQQVADEILGRTRTGWTRMLEWLAETLPDAQPSCGSGLAQHSTLPSRIGALLAALGATLEAHRRTLDLADPSSRREDAAYASLANSFHQIAAELEKTAVEMASYRDLPMGAHDMSAFETEQLPAFRKFVEAEEALLRVLSAAAERDAAMLASG